MPVEPREPGRPVLEPRWLDVGAASHYLCMGVDALYHRIARREIPFVKQGRLVRFDRFALDRWMAKGSGKKAYTFKKERDTPMQPDAAAALKEQLEAEGKLWKQNPQRLREVVAQGAARAHIPHLSPDTLRHTFGTRWLQAGGDIYKLSKILGHASVAVTEAHYAHLLTEDLVAASKQVKIPVAPRGNHTVVPMKQRGRMN